MAMIGYASATTSAWIALSPTPPSPHTAAVSPRCTCRAVPHRTRAGHHAARDQARRGERHVLVDLHRLQLADHRVLGERRRAREVPGGLPLVEEALGAVADRLPAPRRVTGVAHPAHPAVRDGRQHDVVADRDERHALADLLDDARALVAEHRRRRPRDGAVEHRDVGVAEPRRDEPHQDLARPRVAHGQLVGELRLPVAHVHDPSHARTPLGVPRDAVERGGVLPEDERRLSSSSRPRPDAAIASSECGHVLSPCG